LALDNYLLEELHLE